MDIDTLLKIIDKLDLSKDDFGLPLATGGTLFFVEVLFDIVAGAAAGPVAIGGAAIIIGGKFIYDNFRGNKIKYQKAYLKLSRKLAEREDTADLRRKLDTAYDLYVEGLDKNGSALKQEIQNCIEEYISRRNG